MAGPRAPTAGAGRAPRQRGPRSRRPNDHGDFDDQARAGRDLKRQAAASDRGANDAYQAGLRGDPAPADATELERQAWESGVEERGYQGGRRDARRGPRNGAGTRARSTPPPTSGPGSWAGGRDPVAAAPQRSLELGQQGASFLCGLVGYALVLAYVNYGWPGVTSWLSAKFFNKPTLKTQSSPLLPGGDSPKGANPATGQIGTNPSGQPVYGT